MAKHFQKLELVDDFFPALMNGKKTKTLRWNEGDIESGYLLFYATSNPDLTALVWVTNVQTAPMDSFANIYGMSAKDLQAKMVRHYPEIKTDSHVMLIEYLSPEETLQKYGHPEDK